MSDSAIIKDCLVHYDSQHIQVRKDFYDLCAYDKSKFNQKVNSKGNIIKDEPNQECMAKIVRLLETLTDKRREDWFMRAMDAKQKGLQIPEPPKIIFIELVYKSICALLYDTYGESTVRNSVAELLARNFILRRQKTNNSIPEYALNVEVVQEALKQREQNILSGVLKSTATRRTRKKKTAVENNTQTSEINSQAPDFNSQASEINTNNIYSNKGDNKRDKKDTAHVSDDNAPLTQSSLQVTESENTTSPSEQSTKQATSYSQKSTPDTSSSKVETKKNDAPKPPTENKSKGNGKGSRKVELTPEQEERKNAWQKRINDNRGGPLRQTGLRVNEYSCVAQLVKEFSDDDIADIFHYLATKHWKFTKNPRAIGGKDLLDESYPTLKLLREGPSKGNMREQRNQTGIKAGVHVGSSMSPQQPAPSQEQLDEIQRKMIEMGLVPANKQQSKMIS